MKKYVLQTGAVFAVLFIVSAAILLPIRTAHYNKQREILIKNQIHVFNLLEGEKVSPEKIKPFLKMAQAFFRKWLMRVTLLP
jgi:hypothetical protein